MVLAFVIGTFGFNYQVTIALMAREVFGLGAEAFGLLSTVLRDRLAHRRAAVHPAQRPAAAAVPGRSRRSCSALLTVVAGLMPTYASFAVLLVPTGAAALVFSVANNSFVQLGVDPQLRGRVMALYFMCFMGGTPFGAPLIGWISEHLGAPWGLILAAGCAWSPASPRPRSSPAAGGCGSRRGTPAPAAPARGPPAVRCAPLRAAEEAVADRAPGVQALNG